MVEQWTRPMAFRCDCRSRTGWLAIRLLWLLWASHFVNNHILNCDYVLLVECNILRHTSATLNKSNWVCVCSHRCDINAVDFSLLALRIFRFISIVAIASNTNKLRENLHFLHGPVCLSAATRRKELYFLFHVTSEWATFDTFYCRDDAVAWSW